MSATGPTALVRDRSTNCTLRASNRANGTGDGDRLLSVPVDGIIASVDCTLVMSDEQTSTSHSFRLLYLLSNLL